MKTLKAIDVKENLFALMVAVEKELTPEQSFDIVLTGKIPGTTKVSKNGTKNGTPTTSQQKRNKSLSKKDVAEMVKLKEEGMTYAEIGRIYGLGKHGVHNRVRRYKGKDEGKD